MRKFPCGGGGPGEEKPKKQAPKQPGKRRR